MVRKIQTPKNLLFMTLLCLIHGIPVHSWLQSSDKIANTDTTTCCISTLNWVESEGMSRVSVARSLLPGGPILGEHVVNRARGRSVFILPWGLGWQPSAWPCRLGEVLPPRGYDVMCHQQATEPLRTHTYIGAQSMAAIINLWYLVTKKNHCQWEKHVNFFVLHD